MRDRLSPGPARLAGRRAGRVERPGGIRRAATVVRDYIPRGNTLDSETFIQRHTFLCWILGLHLPALFLFGVWQGFGISHSASEIAVPAALLLLARVTRSRRLAALEVTAGLVFCSTVLVHLSGGTIEAHFHFFVLIGLIALYQDWVPFLWNVVFTVLSHGIGSAIAANLIYNHHAAQDRPWSWAAIHGVAVLAACVGVIIFWKNTELAQQRNTALAAELAAAQTHAAQRQSVSELFVNLARRNQALLDRQLALITELEQLERAPDALSQLFRLDHLATRIRRNAESLLVLSGDDSPRRWGRPVPLGDVVRAAAAEVEDYHRVDVTVSDHLELAGRAVADLAHLLAELIENATRYSPPTTEVRVRSYPAPGEWSTFVLSVEDSGIGMTPSDRRAANDLLADPPEVDLRGRRLGFHVVGRLARRYGLRVSLASTPGGGITALVTLPADLVGERQPGGRVGPQMPVTTAPTRATSDALVLTVADVADACDARGVLAPPTFPEPSTGPSGPTIPELTPDGLVRRVPGAGLSPALRQRPAPTAWGADAPAVLGPAAATAAATGSTSTLDSADHDRRRSMLTRFQASQRAGRALADTPDGFLAPGGDS